MEDGRNDYAPSSAKVSVGYPRSGGRRRRLLSPRRTRLCSRRTPSLRGNSRDAPGRRSEPLQYRRDRQWIELTDGILDQLAKFERAKTAERSRRGKLRKAREGKVIIIHTPNYGFKYNASRDGYEVDEEAMWVVRRIFCMVGSERRTLYAVKRTLEREGIPTPSGARFWHAKCIRNYLSEDVYKRHTHDEIMAMVGAGQMSAAVAS